LSRKKGLDLLEEEPELLLSIDQDPGMDVDMVVDVEDLVIDTLSPDTRQASYHGD
jgi:hypothetical protein